VKTERVVPAEVDFASDPLAPRSPVFDDLYHPRAGALEQARHVFLAGNGLPPRWRACPRFVIAETGFGLGHNFLATWQAWRDDPARCERLDFISVDKHPLRRDGLARAHAASPLPDLARALIDAWPPLTPNLHHLDFEGGRVRLLLGFGDATALLRHLVARVDAFYLDGFVPARNPAMWSPELFHAVARLAAPGATAATWSAARVVREGLARAGFEVQLAPGQGGKRDITLARFAPRFVPPAPPGRRLPAHAPEHALVIGAGLAGAASAHALARRGVACTVIERHALPATEASGNPAGLWHGTVGAGDGPHQRWFRSAALHAAQAIDDALRRGVPGSMQGLLRLESARDLTSMKALCEAQGLPDDYVQAWDAAAASARAGVPIARPAWFYPRAGWVAPAALAAHWLSDARIGQRLGVRVDRLEATSAGWLARDRDGRVIAEAPVVVLANAVDTLPWAGLPAEALQARRGQVTSVAARDALLHPRLPVASGAYALGLPDGSLLLGATNQGEDGDAALRESDQQENLARAAALFDGHAVALAGTPLDGRVGWRAATRRGWWRVALGCSCSRGWAHAASRRHHSPPS
jgi:tRNA 5-methylaminomethyl-2-thiouridine biosynthesis bifunctional protein